MAVIMAIEGDGAAREMISRGGQYFDVEEVGCRTDVRGLDHVGPAE